MIKYNLFEKGYVSKTSLGYLLKSPKLFEMYMKGEIRKDSSELNFGKAYDLFLFTPDKAKETVVVFDDTEKIKEILDTYPAEKRASASPKATKAYKEFAASFSEQNESKLVLSIEEKEQIDKMLDIMHSTGVYDRYFAGLTFQQQFDTEIMGVPVRGFYDATSRLLKSVRDSKTYHDEDIGTFAKQARYKFDYDLQCFIYTEAFGAKDFKFIAQSKKPPYTVGVFDASDEFYEYGKQKFVKAVEMLNVFFNADEPKDPNSYVYHGLV